MFHKGKNKQNSGQPAETAAEQSVVNATEEQSEGRETVVNPTEEQSEGRETAVNPTEEQPEGRGTAENSTEEQSEQAATVIKKRGLSAGIVAVICVAAVLAATAVGYFGYKQHLAPWDEGEFVIDDLRVAGVTVDGTDLSGMLPEEAEALIDERADELMAELSVQVEVDGETYTLSAADIRAVTNADEVAAAAVSWGNSGDFAQRTAELATATSLSVNYEYNPEWIAILAERSAGKWSVAPVDAAAEFNDSGEGELFTFVEAQDGFDVQADALAASIESQLKDESFPVIAADIKVTAADVSAQEVMDNLQLVSTYTTTKLGSSGRRFNIVKLAGIVNGTCIMPGETWSINEAAGWRTYGNGWRAANGIESGRLVPQAGGGVCQVSGTLYNAAIRAELTIIERVNHTIPSTYVPVGLDATINSGAQDLKLKNDTDYPVYLCAYVKGDKLTCSVYGTPLKGYTLDFKSRIVKTIGAGGTEVIMAATTPDGKAVPAGGSVTWRSARNGKWAAVTKIITYDDGRVVEEDFGEISKYPAFSGIVYQN